MNPSWLDIAVRTAATSSILGYQRYVSPHKGFACAYRILHRGLSCSEYTKQAIAQNGFFAAIPLIRQRFQACKQASQTLKAIRDRASSNPQPRRESSTPPKKQPSNQGGCAPVNQCQDSAVCCDASSDILECGIEGCSNEELMESCARADCSECSPGLDCSGANCGDWSAIDCSGADFCSGADCCSWG